MTTLCSIACETVHITTGRITVFGTQSTIEVTYPTLVHTFLHGQVEHCFFFTIIDTSNTSIIRLTIVSTNLINHIYRQVLQTSLDITTKEFLTIDHQFLDFLTVDLHITVIVHFGTWQLLYQFFQHGTFRSTVSRSIVPQSIPRYGNLRSLCRNCRLTQHDSIRRQCNLTHIQCRLCTCQTILLHISKVSHERNFQHIFARFDRQTESTIIIGHITGSHGAIRQREQLDSCLHNRGVILLIENRTANGHLSTLCKQHSRAKSYQQN